MKKILLSATLICFLGVIKIQAQTVNEKAEIKPTTAAAATVSTNKESSVKSETKKACCAHSGKSCCMSKEGAFKKESGSDSKEKAEVKSAKTESATKASDN